MSTQTLGPAAATSAPPAGERRRPSLLRRAVFLIPAGLALLAGLDAALMLIGLPAPVRTSRLPEIHGVLMVIGFVGTLISLERAVALRRRTGFAAPALLGLGALLEVSPAPLRVGQAVMLAGTVATTAVYAALWRRQRDDAVLVQTLGSVLSAGAVLLWLGGVPVPLLLPWLVGFVVLTIGGERLELARLAMGPGAGGILVLLSRYEQHDAAGVLRISLVGVGITLFGLLLVAAGGGVRRGSRLNGGGSFVVAGPHEPGIGRHQGRIRCGRHSVHP